MPKDAKDVQTPKKQIPPDKQKLVEAFAWLIQEDKKQNPELYKIKKKKCNENK